MPESLPGSIDQKSVCETVFMNRIYKEFLWKSLLERLIKF